jgi:NADH-quinone oxidoreductase subunit M
LPEAHVEAPTPGSVILAGLLLKLGTYAMARLLLSFISAVIDDVLCFVWILSCLGFNLASIIALNQQDMKKIIAYSSIAHINFSLFGFFGDNILGLSGMFFFMLGHAITSSALFIGIGVLYDRYKTRQLFYFGALALLMPIFASMYFINILSNFAFPGTFNFVGEVLVIASIFKNSNFILVLSILPMVLSLIYSLFFFSRVFFGTLSA